MLKFIFVSSVPSITWFLLSGMFHVVDQGRFFYSLKTYRNETQSLYLDSPGTLSQNI